MQNPSFGMTGKCQIDQQHNLPVISCADLQLYVYMLANHDIITSAGEIALRAPLHMGGKSKILEMLAKGTRGTMVIRFV